MALDKLEYIKQHIGSKELQKTFLEKNNLTTKHKQALKWAFEELSKDRPNMIFIDDAYKILVANNEINSHQFCINCGNKLDMNTKFCSRCAKSYEASQIETTDRNSKSHYKTNRAIKSERQTRSIINLKYIALAILVVVMAISYYSFFSIKIVTANDLYHKYGLVCEKGSGKLFTGIMTGKYPINDKIKYEWHLEDGKLDGLSTSWYKNGQMELKTNYKNGGKDGLDTWWYENGQMKSQINYMNGKGNGFLTAWYKNGQMKLQGNMKNGKNDGSITRWYENGQMKFQGNLIGDKGDGLSTSWYKNGQMKLQGNMKNGKNDGLIAIWYENGQMKSKANYKNGGKDGLDTTWYENGQMKFQGNYINGEKDGSFTAWYENGKIALKKIY